MSESLPVPSDPKDCDLHVRVSAGELERIREAAARADRRVADWVRRMLLRAAETSD